MNSIRLSRFKRVSGLPPIQLTERDKKITRLVYQHRFLRSSQIVALIGDAPQNILRRLQLMYHHGFLERPRAQIEYYRQGGAHHIVYGLGNKGAAILKKEIGNGFRELRASEKNRSVGRIHLEHTLLVSDIMVALELACRKAGDVHLLLGDDIPLPGGAIPPHPFRWKVIVNGNATLGLIPDRVLALEFNDELGERKRITYFLEADRATMPIMRNNLAQTSFYRKLLAYEATWSQGLHHQLFGFNRFRMLTVTTSPGRVKALIDSCSHLKKGHGLFLFADQASLEKHGDIFTFPWKTGRNGEAATLIN